MRCYTNGRNMTQSARSAKILVFLTLFFEICYYFRHRFVSQHSSNPCTIIQLGQNPLILGEIHPFLGKIAGFFLGALRIAGKIQLNSWNKKHCRALKLHLHVTARRSVVKLSFAVAGARGRVSRSPGGNEWILGCSKMCGCPTVLTRFQIQIWS